MNAFNFSNSETQGYFCLRLKLGLLCFEYIVVECVAYLLIVNIFSQKVTKTLNCNEMVDCSSCDILSNYLKTVSLSITQILITKDRASHF